MIKQGVVKTLKQDNLQNAALNVCLQAMVLVGQTSQSFFIISTFVTTLRSCEFEVDNPVDGKDIKEEETMEVVDIRMYHFSAEIVHL